MNTLLVIITPPGDMMPLVIIKELKNRFAAEAVGKQLVKTLKDYDVSWHVYNSEGR